MANNREAYCTYCNKAFRAHKDDLKTHADGKTHRDNAAAYSKKQKKLPFTSNKVTNEVKKAALKLAAFVAVHSAIRSADHLGEMLADISGEGSVASKLRMHRTKLSRLLTHAIAPAMLEELVEDVGNGSYSLIVDESTDISVTKLGSLHQASQQDSKLNAHRLFGPSEDRRCNSCWYPHRSHAILRKYHVASEESVWTRDGWCIYHGWV